MKQWWENNKDEIKLILIVITVSWSAFLTLTGFIWATTDKTAFWARIDVASTQSIDFLANLSGVANVKTDSLLHIVNRIDSMMKKSQNDKLIDYYDFRIEENPRFTIEQKNDILRGILDRHDIGLDSLRVLMRKGYPQ